MAFERYRTNKTSLRVKTRIGGIWIPRFYCDDPTFTALPDPDKPYTRKNPTLHFKVTPLVNYVNENFTWDISASTSVSSTLDKFSILFNGPSTPANIVNANWATDPKTGTVSYNAVGEYVIEAWVDDILNARSQTGSVLVRVIDRPAQAYMVTTDNGVYRLDSSPGAEPVPINTGLSGDDLRGRALKLHPDYKDLPIDQHHIWVCTFNGVMYTTNGGLLWTTFSKAQLGEPENEYNDNPAPTSAELDQIDLAFDARFPQRVYVVRTRSVPAPARTWIYFTENYGQTWDNQQVVI